MRSLFIVCVIDILGFGILIPLVPYMADRFGASPGVITPIALPSRSSTNA